MANPENYHPEDGSARRIVLGKKGAHRNRYGCGSVRMLAQISERTGDNSDTLVHKSLRGSGRQGNSTGRSCNAVGVRWEDERRGDGFGAGRRHRIDPYFCTRTF